MKKYVPLIGRILISVIFILSGIFKITNFSGTAGFVGSLLPAASFFVVVAIIIEILGGLSILFGYKAKWVALALFVYVIVAGLIFHTNFGDQNQIAHFMKNLAIAGGLLYVWTFGPGAVSIDKK